MPTKLRVLVLGANGFIGRAIVQTLALDPQIQAIAGVRRRRQESGEGSEIEVDATDAASVKRACGAVDVVVFALAGRDGDMRQAIGNVCQAIQAATFAPHLIFLSSISVYGSASRSVDEEALLDAHSGRYGEMKIFSEGIVKKLPKWTVLRPGIVYGAGSNLWTLHIGDLISSRKIKLDQKEMSAICNAIYIDDLARTVKECIFSASASNQVFNVVGEDALTWSDFFGQYAKALTAPWPTAKGSLRQEISSSLHDKVAFALHKLRQKIGGGDQRPPPLLRPWLKDQCRQGPAVSASKIRRTLSMSWTSLEVGISQSMPWLASQLNRSSKD